MVQINPANIINILSISFDVPNISSTAVNNREIELSDIIKQLIINEMNAPSLITKYVKALEFENITRLPKVPFVEEDNVQQNEVIKVFNNMCKYVNKLAFEDVVKPQNNEFVENNIQQNEEIKAFDDMCGYIVDELEFEDVAKPPKVEFVEKDNMQQNKNIEILDSMCVSNKNDDIDLNYKIKAVEFWRNVKTTRKRSLKSVQHSFKKVTSNTQLYRWERYLAKGGTNRDKSLSISQYVFQKFKEAVCSNYLVRDRNIKQWALEAKKQMNFSTFKAGRTWLRNFKKTHNIDLKKLAKLIKSKTQSQHQYNNGINNYNCSNFVTQTKPCINRNQINGV